MADKRFWRIAQRRKQLHISQEELAESLGTTQSQISMYETGKNEPGAKVLDDLADALDTTVDYLLGRTGNPDRPLRGEFDLDEVEREAIKVLRSKPPTERKRVVEIMRLA